MAAPRASGQRHEYTRASTNSHTCTRTRARLGCSSSTTFPFPFPLPLLFGVGGMGWWVRGGRGRHPQAEAEAQARTPQTDLEARGSVLLLRLAPLLLARRHLRLVLRHRLDFRFGLALGDHGWWGVGFLWWSWGVWGREGMCVSPVNAARDARPPTNRSTQGNAARSARARARGAWGQAAAALGSYERRGLRAVAGWVAGVGGRRHLCLVWPPLARHAPAPCPRTSSTSHRKSPTPGQHAASPKCWTASARAWLVKCCGPAGVDR